MAPSFGLTGGTGVVTKISGGTINLVQANSGSPDYNETGTMVYSGGTLNVGTAATATNFVFRVQGQTPNVVIDNTTNNKTLNLSGQLNVWGNLTINAGTTVNVNPGTAQTLLQIGPTITNNGAIITNTTNTGTVNFAGSLQALGGGYAQTYTGTGTFGTPSVRPVVAQRPERAGRHDRPGRLGAQRVPRQRLLRRDQQRRQDLARQRRRDRALVIQRGATGIAFPPGSLDAAPTFNVGSGGLTAVYAQSQAPGHDRPRDPGHADVLEHPDHQPDGRHARRR